MSAELYSRQESLSLLKYNTAVVVGLGGVGNWVALDLALSGQVKSLILIDPDTVEESNLNRTIFRYSDIGALKVEATKFQILERRADCLVECHAVLTNTELLNDIARKIIYDQSVYDPDCLIMDCRDDIYDDLHDFNCKLYKVGYDGTSMTIDGNPRLTKVWTQRGGSYRVIPSYIGSSQIVAALAVNDALGAGFLTQTYSEVKNSLQDCCENPFLRNFCTDNGRDELGRLNCSIRFDCGDIFSRCASDQVKQHDETKVIEIIKKQAQEERE